MGGQRIRSLSRCKFVRFAAPELLHDYSDSAEELTWEIIEDVWWQPDDFHSFKVSAKVLADEAIDKGICRYLDRNYGFSDDKTQNALNLWAKCKTTRRGLERFINKEYAQRRIELRHKTIHAVLYTQQQLHEEIQCGDPDSAAEVIRNVAVAVSEPCQHFAYMLAKADAMAGALRVRKRQKPVFARSPNGGLSEITTDAGSVANTSVTSAASSVVSNNSSHRAGTMGTSRVRPTSSTSTSSRRRPRRTAAAAAANATNASTNEDTDCNASDTSSLPSVWTNVTEISKPRVALPPKPKQQQRKNHLDQHLQQTQTKPEEPPATTPKFVPPSPTTSQSTQPVSVCSSTASARRNLPTIIQF